MEKKKYIVIDLQDGKDVLGHVDTMKEVHALTKQRYDETDGDCYIVFTKLNKEINGYPKADRKIATF